MARRSGSGSRRKNYCVHNLLSGRSLALEPLEERRLLAVVVNTLVDEADGSIVDGDISLRDALALAPAGETINFAAALTAGGPATITLTTLGQIVVNKSISIVGPGANLLTIDASGNDPSPSLDNGTGSRIFDFNDGLVANSNVLIQALSLTGADFPGFGGAVRSFESLTVRDAIIYLNSANNGGAIGSIGPLFVYDSEIRDNNAKLGGGAIHIGNSATSAEIARSTIRNNNTPGPGGGVYVAPNRLFAVSINNSLIAGNEAGTSGGGLASESPLAITASSIVDNHAELNGGGILAAHANIVLTQVTVSGNTADGGGGGIFASQPLQIRYSTIADNTANADGNAQATAVGGGIQYVDSTNPADPNRAILLFHTIVGDNDRTSGGSAADDLFSGTVLGAGNQFRLDYGLVELSAGFNQQVSVAGPSVLGVDPKLGPLMDNGGPTLPGARHLLTHALLPGSPAINTGNPAAAAGVGSVPQFDERGTPFSRVLNGRIDLGAVEFPTSTLAGDYFRNGVVDAADYTVWRDTLGSTTNLRADGSGAVVGTPDGVVDQHDYAYWKANFGNTLGAGVGAGAIADADSSAPDAGEDSNVFISIASIAQSTSFAVPLGGDKRAIRSRLLESTAGRSDALLAWLASHPNNRSSHRDAADIPIDDRENESSESSTAFDEAFDQLSQL